MNDDDEFSPEKIQELIEDYDAFLREEADQTRLSLGSKGSTTHLFSASASGSTSQLFLKQQQQPWGTTTPLLQALTTSPEFCDLTSDSEVSREHTSSGKVKRSRLAAGLGELTLIAESSSTSLVIQAEGDDDVGLFPNEDGFVDMGLLPYPPFTRWGFRYPKT